MDALGVPTVAMWMVRTRLDFPRTNHLSELVRALQSWLHAFAAPGPQPVCFGLGNVQVARAHGGHTLRQVAQDGAVDTLSFGSRSPPILQGADKVLNPFPGAVMPATSSKPGELHRFRVVGTQIPLSGRGLYFPHLLVFS